MPKFQMVTTNIMVSKDLNIMKIDELSGFLLTVEKSNPTEETKHVFSTTIEEEEEAVAVNIKIRIKIGIHNSHIIFKEMHPLQEEEVQVSSKEEA
jgi:hypothetical protein